MKTDRFVRLMLAVLVLGPIMLPAPALAGGHETYKGAVAFAPQIVQLPGGCLWVDGTLSSGNFFDGLERKDRSGLFQYTHDGTVLTNYPDSVNASIRILDDQCVPDPSDAGQVVSNDRPSSFTFNLAWKTDLQLRSVAISASDISCVGRSGKGMPSALPMTCSITVKSKGIPLSDHLIVSVLGSGGARLARLSAAP